MKKKINETLAELLCGILASGVVIQLADLAVTEIYRQFRGMRLLFAGGFWIGIAVAALLAVHMHCSIDHALDMSPKDAESYMRRAYLIRAAVILLVAAGVKYLHLGYVMAYFVGVLCLKFGAFLQRLLHLSQKKKGRPGETP